MAVNNTQNNYAKMEFPLTIKRQDAFSIDPTEIWPSLEAAQEPETLCRRGWCVHAVSDQERGW